MLEIYIHTLEEHEVEARDKFTDLSSKKEMLNKKNAQRMSNNSSISYVSGMQSSRLSAGNGQSQGLSEPSTKRYK